MEKAMKLKAKIKGAMIYPATIITVATGVTTVLLIWVIPVFAELFSSFGQALPAPTQFVINLSNVTIAYFPFMLAVAIGAAVALRQLGTSSVDRAFCSRLGDSPSPVVARAAQHLISSGVPSRFAAPPNLGQLGRYPGDRLRYQQGNVGRSSGSRCYR
jgi:hypothetical protein